MRSSRRSARSSLAIKKFAVPDFMTLLVALPAKAGIHGTIE